MIQKILFLLLFFLSAIAQGQIKIPTLENTSFKRDYIEDSSISKLKEESKVLIMFRRYSVWSFYSKYCVLTLGNDDSLRYHILVTDPDMKGLYRVKKSASLLDSIWTNCFQNNLFKIKTESKNHNKCNSMIFDSNHYEFIIFANKKKKSIEYYAPEFFESECPGDKDRINMINCAKPFISNNKLL